MKRQLAVPAFTLLLAATALGVRTADHGWPSDLVLKVKRVGPVVFSPDGPRVAFVVSDAKHIKDAMERNLEWFDRGVQGRRLSTSAPE